MKEFYDIVICGAGIAGISSAYYLSANYGITDILLVDEHPPLSLTSDKSTECYRNWWPGPGDAMVKFMNRSIDLLESLAEESSNAFHLNRRGYLYVTGDESNIENFIKLASEPSKLGAGPLRIHRNQPGDPIYSPLVAEGYREAPDGADLFLDASLITKHFPNLSEEVISVLHVRRAGWFSAQQLGMYLFKKVRENGINYYQAKVINVKVVNNRVSSVTLDSGEVIHTGLFVNAAGPFLRQAGKLVDLELPVYCEFHQKAAFRDYLGVISRNAPLLIWTDPQRINWNPDERVLLAEDLDTHWLLDELPSGAHTRPEGGDDSQIVLMLWEYTKRVVEPVLSPKLDLIYPELALRGLVKMLPGLQKYTEKLPRFTQDGGYYTKTKENRPLISPQPVEGSYVIGALSGFGLMAACAAGELLAAHVTKSKLPEYAPAFCLDRYNDPQYLSLLEDWGDAGQL
jgi:sarcosine oxidase, subunit beta